ncbi:MAG: gephyrin-like molybdotransferase Glp [Actinomycetota bacterium]
MTPTLSVDEYYRRIVDSVRELPANRVALHHALGRVAASDVRCRADLPPFDTAAMDGFAVRADDVAGASAQSPARLEVVGQVRMGRVSNVAVEGGQAVAVPTGGQVSPGADAVVPMELCTVDGSMLSVHEPCLKGKNVRLAGEDSCRGELVVPSGRRLRPTDIGALAAAGAGEVEVAAAPGVGVISTGDELVPPGRDLRAGQIYDSNSYLLGALVAQLGARPVDLGRTSDDPGVLLTALREASEQVDVLICSGGVSVGSNDPVRRAIAEGLQAECVNVAMKPGRPQAFGHVGRTPLIALPGNPVSALVSFEVFVRPVLHKMMGLVNQDEYHRTVLADSVHGVADRICYVPVHLHRESGGWVASCAGMDQPNRLGSLSSANGLVRLPPGTSVSAGECAEVLMF